MVWKPTLSLRAPRSVDHAFLAQLRGAGDVLSKVDLPYNFLDLAALGRSHINLAGEVWRV